MVCKRRFRDSMEDQSMDESINELERLAASEVLSPATRRIMQEMELSLTKMKGMSKDAREYLEEKASHMRVEILLTDILVKDERYDALNVKFSKMQDEKRRLELGDYHRNNLSVIHNAARKYKQAVNKGKPKQIHIENPIEGVPYKELLATLNLEKAALNQWRNAIRHSESAPPMPAQPITEWIERSVTTKYCARTMSMDQLFFELEQYCSRNEIAHLGIDEIKDKAKAEDDPKSPYWSLMAQAILSEKEKVQRGQVPKELEGHEGRLMESLQLYQEHWFLDIKVVRDSKGIDMPGDFTVRECHLEPPDAEGENKAVTARVVAMVPEDSWELEVKETYLAAVEEVKSMDDKHRRLQQEEMDLKGDLVEARKALRHARLRLKVARASFSSYETWKRKNPNEDEDEMMGGLED